jgi:hypothetical protein
MIRSSALGFYAAINRSLQTNAINTQTSRVIGILPNNLDPYYSKARESDSAFLGVVAERAVGILDESIDMGAIDAFWISGSDRPLSAAHTPCFLA